MTLVSAVARDNSVGMSYGGYGTPPTTLEIALFSGDPTNGGTELTSAGGYERLVVPNDATTWPDAPADGSITSAVLEFAVSTDAWSDTANFFQIYDADTGDAWDSGELADEVSVNEADVPVPGQITVYYNALGV